MSNYTFSTVPTIHRRRTRFRGLSHGLTTSFSAGKAVPILVQEVYPGDSFSMRSRSVCRATSGFVRPFFGNFYVDEMFFFVPNRTIMNDWGQVMGDPGDNPWVNPTPPSVPLLSIDSSGAAQIPVGYIADYFGMPTKTQLAPKTPYMSVLPFRAYAKIWNDWLRNENTDDPKNIVKTSTPGAYEKLYTSDTFADWSQNVNVYTAGLAPVCKDKDYFTSCLPAPQRGEAIDAFGDMFAPLKVGGSQVDLGGRPRLGFSASASAIGFYPLGVEQASTSALSGYAVLSGAVSESGVPRQITSTNLGVNLGGSLSVNDLRLAFQTQKILERAARSGGRYIEYIRSAFGVDPGDARLQRAEYLGGSRNPVHVQQVPQTSGSADNEYLGGSIGAYGLAVGQAKWSKGFTEHGFIIGIACVRQTHVYQQGLERFWRRSQRFDFYDPTFQNIGEQPVYESEICIGGPAAASSATGDPSLTNVFGYQEAWADLRFRPNRISGSIRTDFTSDTPGLDVWHIGDDYDPSTPPHLDSDFVHETEKNLDRVLNVPSTTEAQFIFDFWFDINAVRVLPAYSVPGLIDHH